MEERCFSLLALLIIEGMISIDLPEGPFGGGYPFWMVPFFKSFGRKQVIHLIRADSHSEEALGKLKPSLKAEKLISYFHRRRPYISWG